MKAFIRLTILCSSFLFSFYSFGQIQPTNSESSKPTDASGDQGNQQVLLLIPSQHLIVDTKGVSFEPQFGLGVTGIFAQGLWYVPTANDFYHGGFQVNFLWRLHPRLTFEVGGEALFSNISDETSGQNFYEMGAFLGLRIFVLNPPANLSGFHLMPYVSVGPELNALFPSIHYERTDTSPGYYSHISLTYPLLYLGGYLGAGLELRLGRHFAINGDLRFIVQGPIDVYGYGGNNAARLGLRGSVGLAVYF